MVQIDTRLFSTDCLDRADVRSAPTWRALALAAAATCVMPAQRPTRISTRMLAG
jgi:hypothetical protein